MPTQKAKTKTTKKQNIDIQNTVLWIGIFVFVLICLWALDNVIAPFVAGIIIAYLLNPAVKALHERNIPRWAASISVLTLFFIVLVIGLSYLFPIIVHEISELMINLPIYFSSLTHWGQEWLQSQISKLPVALPSLQDISQLSVIEPASQLSGGIWGGFKNVAGRVFSGGTAIFDIVSFVIVMPIVTFYCIRDWPKMIHGLQKALPKKHRKTIDQLIAELDKTLSGFIRGQAIVALSLGAFYALGLSLIGLNFGVAIGFIAGLLSIIPYVGSLVGFILAVGVALIQFDAYTMAIQAAFIFGIGQFIEGNVLTPKLVGERVGLHPVWIIFALMAGGELMGFTGLLLAVPMAAVIGVGVRFLLKN